MTRATLLSIVLLSACGTTSPVVSESDLAGTFSAHVDGERIMPDGSIVPFDANGTLQVISGARALSVDPMAGCMLPVLPSSSSETEWRGIMNGECAAADGATISLSEVIANLSGSVTVDGVRVEIPVYEITGVR
jgi:hypothetical protein